MVNNESNRAMEEEVGMVENIINEEGQQEENELPELVQLKITERGNILEEHLKNSATSDWCSCGLGLVCIFLLLLYLSFPYLYVGSGKSKKGSHTSDLEDRMSIWLYLFMISAIMACHAGTGILLTKALNEIKLDNVFRMLGRLLLADILLMIFVWILGIYGWLLLDWMPFVLLPVLHSCARIGHICQFVE